MTAEEQEIIEKLKALVHVPIQIFPAVVSNIDESTAMCDVTSNGLELFDVRLRAVEAAGNGVLIVPAEKSNVLVARIGNGHELFVVSVSEVKKIVWSIKNGSDIYGLSIDSTGITFNNNKLGGFLTDIAKLVSKINTLENDTNTLKTIFKTWVVAPSDGGAALKTAAATWAAQSLTTTVVADIKDPLIKN